MPPSPVGLKRKPQNVHVCFQPAICKGNNSLSGSRGHSHPLTRTMPFLRVVLNTEIVSSIASYAYWGVNCPDIPLDLRTVLALALTCRAFLEPALDQLWRRQLTLFNLVRTLPSDCWETYQDKKYKNYDGNKLTVIKTTRVIIPNDWMRFDYYADRIKEIGYDPRAPFGTDELPGSRKAAVPDDFVNAMFIVRLPFELVPNVKRVRWTTHELKVMIRPHVYMFLNPPLTSLVLDFHDAPLDPGRDWCPDARLIKYTLKAITEQCPSFRDVEILWKPHEGLAESVWDFMKATPAVRTLVLTAQDWTDEMLGHLASLPKLRKTRVYLSSTSFSWLRKVPEWPPFKALTDFTLEAPSLEYCIDFFTAIRDAYLQKFTVISADRPSALLLMRFTTNLWARVEPNGLRSLCITDTDRSPISQDAPGDHIVGTDALLQLRFFTNLREFTLDLSSMYELSSTFIDSLLGKFPSLEKLSLGEGYGWGQRSSLGFADLAKVVEVCPMLEQLCISIDAAQHEQAAIPPDAKSNTRLKTIDLSDSYVSQDSAGAVALSKNLATLFPELEHIRAKTPGWKTKRKDYEGDEENEESEAVEVPAVEESDEAYEGLAGEDFWREVEKQVATFALLRDMGVPMDMS
ncbi:hypothetical protein FKP32DRAFT_948570 [Trametes sanguinea]|nr:hypothetical protein FKP32DRAFT_948570 [Trametes sanguinea]